MKVNKVVKDDEYEKGFVVNFNSKLLFRVGV